MRNAACFFPLIAMALVLGGCSTKYGQMGFTGGVDAQRIDDRTVRVSGRGNGYTDPVTVREFVLLKSAEETLGAGYRYFSVVGSADASRSGTYTTPGTATTNVYGYGNYATAQTTYTPGYTVDIFKPGQDVMIRMYSEQEVGAQAPAGLYDAAQIKKYLGPKYIKAS